MQFHNCHKVLVCWFNLLLPAGLLELVLGSLTYPLVPCFRKVSPLYFLYNLVKNEPNLTVLGIQIPKEIWHTWCWTCPPRLRHATTLLREMQMIYCFLQNRWFCKQPVYVVWQQLSFMQATPWELLKVAINCGHTLFWSFAAVCCFIHYAVLAFSPNKPVFFKVL